MALGSVYFGLTKILFGFLALAST